MADNSGHPGSALPWDTRVEVWVRIARGDTDSAIARELLRTDWSASRSSIARLRKAFRGLSGVAVAQLPNDLRHHWQHITGRELPLPQEAQAGLLSIPDDTVRELVAFADLLVERLEPPKPSEAARAGSSAALWMGRATDVLLLDPPTDPALRAVEADWPAARGDLRGHPLFLELRKRLGTDHPAFKALVRVQASHDAYCKASAEAREHFSREVLGASGLFSEEEGNSLADVMLLDSFHRASGGAGIAFDSTARDVAGATERDGPTRVWRLRLGAASVQRPTHAQIEEIRLRWPALVDAARESEAIERLAATWQAVLAANDAFRSGLPTGASLRDVLMTRGRATGDS